ncbi:MAG: MFS transporter [Parvularculaceae bacterium]
MAARAPGRNALLFIFITVMINMIGFGIIIPVMPQLIMDVTGRDLSHAARWGGILSLVFAAAQFIMLPIMGSLSDRYGRRPVILTSLLAYSADFLILRARAFNHYHAYCAPLLWPFPANLCDIERLHRRHLTARKARSQFRRDEPQPLVGLYHRVTVGACPISKQFGHRAPFFAVAAPVSGAFTVTISCRNQPMENRRAFSWRRANRRVPRNSPGIRRSCR